MNLVRAEIAAMEGYVPGEQPPPGKYVKLNTNENPYPPSESVSRALIDAAGQLRRYPDPHATALRHQVTTLTGYPPEWVLCGNGSDDLLTILFRAFLAPGDVIRCPTPSYILYGTLARLQGAVCDQTPYAPDWTLDDRFLRADTRLRLAIVANPNSPSGTTIPSEELGRIADRLPCPLVIDEAYVDFADRDCLELVGQRDNVLVMRSLSKSYALAGLRCGYLIAPPALIAELNKVKDSYNCSTLAIAGGTAALADQDWLRATLDKILATRARATERLRGMNFHVPSSQSNFVWCTREPGVSGPPSKVLFESLKRQRILVRYMDYPHWGDGLRISIGTDEQMDACFAVLESELRMPQV